jgi:hypothetical protein
MKPENSFRRPLHRRLEFGPRHIAGCRGEEASLIGGQHLPDRSIRIDRFDVLDSFSRFSLDELVKSQSRLLMIHSPESDH